MSIKGFKLSNGSIVRYDYSALDNIVTDDSLSVPGVAADGKAVGDEIAALEARNFDLDESDRLKISGLSGTTSEVTDRIEQVRTALGTEVATRMAADASFEADMVTERNVRAAADNAEKSERVAADNTEKSERVAADSDLLTRINVEKSRIDNIEALPDGSTTADAELINIRIGYDNTEYSSAGNAVRAQISDVKADLNGVAEATCDSYPSSQNIDNTVTWTNGYYQADGTFISSNNYVYTEKISVKAGDIVTCLYNNGSNSHSFRTVTAYNGDVVIANSGTDTTTSSYTVPDGINYIRVTVITSASEHNAFVRLSRPVYTYVQKTDKDFILDRPITETSGYIQGNGTIATASANLDVYTNKLEVAQCKVDWAIQYPSTKSAWIAYATYGYNGSFIQRIALYSASGSSFHGRINVPDNVKYIAFTYRTFGSCQFTANVIPNIDDLRNDATALSKGYADFNEMMGGKYWGHLFAGQETASFTSDIIIPYQSIFDVQITSRLGFKYIEANVKKTSDNKYVVTHGISGKLGNDFETLDGQSASDVVVASTTFNDLRTNYRYRSLYDKYKVPISSLEEFLYMCKQCGILPLLQYVDDTSLNIAIGIVGNDLILYNGTRDKFDGYLTNFKSLSTKEDILAWCEQFGPPYLYSMSNTTDFTDEQLKDIIHELHQNGYHIVYAESYATLSETQRLLKLGFDGGATKRRPNKFESGNLLSLASDLTFDDFTTTGTVSNGTLSLSVDDTVISNTVSGFLLKWSLEIMFDGTLNIDGTEYISDGTANEWFSGIAINGSTHLAIRATEATDIYNIKYVVSKC